MNSYRNRMLQEYYDIMRTRGKEAADMVYDAYDAGGRFMDGPTMLDRGRDLMKGKGAQKAMGVLDKAADPIQQVLMKGADSIPLGKGGAMASRMAGGAIGKAVARGIPVLGALTAVGDVGDIVLGGDSMANKAMDTLGMGVGGTAGFFLGGPLGAAAGASVGKAISDGTQFLLGGGKSAEERKMEEALMMLRGGQY